jgi:glycosyltransferase involved in cell wall biosynthesis
MRRIEETSQLTDSLPEYMKIDHRPLISVVMNCYNSARYLRESIESVLEQTYSNWEIVFWDNQSTDESAAIFKSYIDSRLKYFLAPEHTKLGQARNLAVAHATGEWLGFLDCDDAWLPGKLERQVEIIIHENPDLGIVYGQCLVIRDNSGTYSQWASRQYRYANKTVLKILPEGDVLGKYLKFNFIPMVTAIVSRAAYFEVGGLSAHFEQAEDYELFAKIAATRKTRAVQDVIALYRVHENNSSILNEDKGFKEALEIICRYLPTPMAIRGLSYRHSSYALRMICDGKLRKGVIHLLNYGNLLDLFEISYRKIARVL